MKLLVTGCAGFIGAATSTALLEQGHTLIGIDNLNDYYDVNLKKARLDQLRQYDSFQFYADDLADKSALDNIFQQHRPHKVINLAAQAGVRYSLKNPQAYVNSNLVGFANLLEACRHYEVTHLLFASSSSVYGDTQTLPLTTTQSTDEPLSLYAATKKSNELLAHSYSHLYGLAVTGLRYFTVYGPWGRPDMAPFIFTQRILNNLAIDIFNGGQHRRDFTFIDDAVDATVKLLSGEHFNLYPNTIPYKIYNIAYGQSIELDYFISLIEKALGKTATKNIQDKQAGDVTNTWADISELKRDIAYQPKVTLDEGILKFVDWFKTFYA